jgi:dTDP-4-amino-4,6-dideoxygalactose transaminase
VSRELKSDYSNNDDFIDLFEQKLCEYTGAPYAVAVDRCTNAIILCLEYVKNHKQQISVPKRTYLSVPMMINNWGYKITFRDEDWVGKYRLGWTNIWDCAVGFDRNMYEPGQIQCLSFQTSKRLSIGKGGAILLDDYEMYKKLSRMRRDGRETHTTTIQEMEKSLDTIIMGYHMNMNPDEAAKGVYLLNQLKADWTPGSYLDYPDVTTLKCFKEIL